MKKYIYLDSAASSQMPAEVRQTLMQFYEQEYAPVHRGIYQLAECATGRFEGVRTAVAQFINAASADEIVFTKNATESINLVASTWALTHLQKGDIILLSHMEHHSNLVPWQRVAQLTGAELAFIPLLADGTLDYDALPLLITERTKLISVVHVSNGLGTLNDIARIAQHAQRVGVKLLVDACQSAGHITVNVQELGADFLVFSGHKMLAPTGVGVLYIKKNLHEHMPPYQLGGGMVERVNWHDATYLSAPRKFEAGTPPIAQVIGLGAALRFLNASDRISQQKLEAQLCAQTIEGLQKLKGIRIFGPIDQLIKHGHLVSFTVDGIHPHDVAAFLDSKNICVRAGDFCLQPLWRMLGVQGAVRVSFYYGNTAQHVQLLLSALQELIGS